MHRGDVYIARLGPTVGSEQAGRRPVVIVGRDSINQSHGVVIVVPVTGLEHRRRIYPSQVVFQKGQGGLTKDSVALCDQIVAVSKEQFDKHLGHLPMESLVALDRALKVALDLP